MVVSLVNRVPARLATLFRQGGLLARVAAPVLERVLPDHPREIVVRSGRARGVHLVAELKREKFYWTGSYESQVQDALAAELRPGGRFWDVGAHLGFFTLLASRLVGPDGKVHAFEPLPANRARLQTGISLNGAANITLHPVALAGRSGRAVLHSHGSTLMWSLLPNGDAGSLEVDCRTLDALAAEIGAPDVIKIDAEGAEVDVLRGGLELLRHQRPTLIVEFSDEARLAEAEVLLPGYAFELLSDLHYLLRPRR